MSLLSLFISRAKLDPQVLRVRLVQQAPRYAKSRLAIIWMSNAKEGCLNGDSIVYWSDTDLNLFLLWFSVSFTCYSYTDVRLTFQKTSATLINNVLSYIELVRFLSLINVSKRHLLVIY